MCCKLGVKNLLCLEVGSCAQDLYLIFLMYSTETMFDSIEHVFKIREIFLLKINFGRKKKSCILKRQNSLKMLFLIFLVFGAKLDHVYYYFFKKTFSQVTKNNPKEVKSLKHFWKHSCPQTNLYYVM